MRVLRLLLTLCWLLVLTARMPAFGAVDATNLTTNGSTTDLSSYSTASITPTANKLILAAVTSSAGAAPNDPTASGNGLTWVEVNTSAHGSVNLRTTVFRALGSSPSSGTVTFDFGGQTQTNCTWSIVEFGSVDTSGTNGSAAVVQSAQNTATSTTSLTVTLSAFSGTGNATAGFFGLGSNNANTAGSGFTIVAQTGCCGTRTASEFRNDNDTTVDASWSQASSTGVAVEIKVAPNRRPAAPLFLNQLPFFSPLAMWREQFIPRWFAHAY